MAVAHFLSDYPRRRYFTNIMKAHFISRPCNGRSFALQIVLAALIALAGTFVAGCGGGGNSASTVVTAPTITTQATSQTVATGKSITLSVAASGSNLKYQWYKDGNAISGATASAYTISSAAAADAGSYYVVVSNSAGTVTGNAVTLTVAAATGSSQRHHQLRGYLCTRPSIPFLSA